MKKAKDYRFEARQTLKNNWGNAILACIVVSAISGVLAFIPLIGTIAMFVIEGPFMIGLVCYFIKLRNTKQSDINELGVGFKNNLGENFLTYLLINIFTILWSFLFIIPGLIKSYSYSMTMFLRAKKPELSATDSIKLSQQIMQGKKWKLFCLHISFIGWILLSLFTLGLGLLIILPYMQASTVSFYEEAYANYFDEPNTFHSDVNNEPKLLETE